MMNMMRGSREMTIMRSKKKGKFYEQSFGALQHDMFVDSIDVDVSKESAIH